PSCGRCCRAANRRRRPASGPDPARLPLGRQPCAFRLSSAATCRSCFARDGATNENNTQRDGMAQIGIVGGGLMGCATALNLRDPGPSVTILERDAGGLPASVGNAGILAVPEIDPLARLDMLLSVPKWLLDPLG